MENTQVRSAVYRLKEGGTKENEIQFEAAVLEPIIPYPTMPWSNDE